mmetsp:Transcript_7103/g.19031  ORF Transcript_7103/g.19031 Transcript_7103/m.19031 type:complete len:379 (+) Transcript_7103:50-1186(+)
MEEPQAFVWLLVSMALALLDYAVALLIPFAPGQFWSRGSGNMERVYMLMRKESDIGLAGFGDIANVRVEKTERMPAGGHLVKTAVFQSPLGNKLPEEAREARIQIVEPRRPRARSVVVIHLQATGDEGFSLRRKYVALPLAEAGVTSILLQIPFYGSRRARGQVKYYSRTLEEYMLCATGAYTEGAMLARWVQRQYSPFASLVFTGFSFGGSMATWAAMLLADTPCALVSCCGPSSPHAVLSGVLRRSLDWRAMANEHDGQHFRAESRVKSVFDDLTDLSARVRVEKARRHANGRAGFVQHVCVSIAARDDGFVPLSEMRRMHRIQLEMDPNAALHVVAGGHASTFLRAQEVYVPYILSAIDELHRRLDHRASHELRN